MTDPLANLEEAHAQHGLGVLTARIYSGALESGSRWDAFWATAAYIRGMTMSGMGGSGDPDDNEDAGDDESPDS